MDAFTALIAGILTVLSPCILPILPIIVGGSVGDETKKSWRKPLVITASLAVSVTLFTLLIRGTTAVFDVSESMLATVSGVIIVIFGVFMLYPQLWDQISLKLGFGNSANRALASASSKNGIWGEILIGAALGPVFTSCSPTFGLILATVLPVSFAEGAIYIAIYVIGMSATLLAIAIAGNKLVSKLGWATDPHSKFRRTIGMIFIIVGVAIITGIDKEIEAWIVNTGIYDPIVDLESELMQ